MNIRHRHVMVITPNDSEAKRYAQIVKQSLKMRGIRADQRNDKTGISLNWSDNISIYIDETAMLINELGEVIETQEASIRDRDEKIDELKEQIELLKKLP